MPGEAVDGKRLWAAFARDILRQSEGVVADVNEAPVSTSSADFDRAAGRSTTVRRHVPEGREFYVASGSWPFASRTTSRASWWKDDEALAALKAWAETKWLEPPDPVHLRTLTGSTVCELEELLALMDALEPRALRLAEGGSLLVGWRTTFEGMTSRGRISLVPRPGAIRRYLGGYPGLGGEQARRYYAAAEVTVCLLADPTPAHRGFYPARDGHARPIPDVREQAVAACF